MKAYFQFWRKYTDFDGKTSRSEFIQAFVIHLLVSPVLMFGIPIAMMFSCSLDVDATMFVFRILGGLYGAAWLVPFASMVVRRLRDAGYAPKSLLLIFIPIIGMIALLARLLTKSAE